MSDWIYDNIGWILLGFILLTIGGLIYIMILSNKEDACCLRKEYRIVHQKAWVQYIYTGKIMVPIYHPEGDYNQNVCVEAKPNCK